MNNIVRLITKSSKYFSINPQYKMLKILKLDEIYKLELAKFMHNLHHNNLPFIFKRQFTYLTNWHTHKTRCADSFNYFLPRVKKKFSQNLLSFRGTKLWMEIDSSLKILNTISFKKEYKHYLISSY